MLTLETALQNIPDLDRTAKPIPLPGGLSNRSWEIRIGGVAHVLRLNHANTIRPRDFSHELAIHKTAHEAGLAPAIYFADEQYGLLVTEKADGGSLSADDLQKDATIEDVARLMRRVHDLPLSGERLDFMTHAEHYARGIRTEIAGPAADVIKTLAYWLDRLAPIQASTCHNDPVAENFIQSKPPVLIDWEFAADNDPMFDLAVISAHHELADDTKRRLLKYYGISADNTEITRLDGWETVYRCLYWLWLAARVSDEAPANKTLAKLLPLIRDAR